MLSFVEVKAYKGDLPPKGKFRADGLNQNWFLALADARDKIE